MTNEKKYTNVTALQAVLDGVAVEGALADKVAAMLKAEQNKANRSRAKDGKPTAAVLKNRGLCIACLRSIADAGNEPRTNDWISEHTDGIFKASEASGKMGIALAHGLAEYGVNDGKKRTYTVTDAGMQVINGAEFPPKVEKPSQSDED